MKKSAIVVVLSVLVVVLAIWAVSGLFSGRPVKDPAPNPVVEKISGAKLIAEEKPRGRDVGENSGMRKSRRNGKDAKTVVRHVRQVEDPYTPEERKLADTLQDASDENSLGSVRKAVVAIMRQENPELKIEAINALGFYGKDSLKDLMAFLKDSSREVIDAATDRIALSLEELGEDESDFKVEFISTLLSIDGLCGKDAVERFVGQMEALGAGNAKVVVPTLVSLIDGKDAGDFVKAKAKEAYKFVTGEEYTTFEAAEKWYTAKAAEEESAKQVESDGGDESGESSSGDGNSDDDSERDDGDESAGAGN